MSNEDTQRRKWSMLEEEDRLNLGAVEKLIKHTAVNSYTKQLLQIVFLSCATCSLLYDFLPSHLCQGHLLNVWGADGQSGEGGGNGTMDGLLGEEQTWTTRKIKHKEMLRIFILKMIAGFFYPRISKGDFQLWWAWNRLAIVTELGPKSQGRKVTRLENKRESCPLPIEKIQEWMPWNEPSY